MRITKDQLRDRVGKVDVRIDQLFRMTKEELRSLMLEELPGCQVTGTRDEFLRMLLKYMINKEFHPGWH